MTSREIDYWGDPTGQGSRRLSICDLIANHTLDSRVAAYLWARMEDAPSILVLSGPRLAGKTTTVNAMLDLAPAGSRFIHIQGNREAFDFPDLPAHDPTYLVSSEVSPGPVPFYIWESGVKRLFTYPQRGYRLSVTMHADSVEEAVAQLRAEPNGVALENVAAFDLVVVIAVGYREGEMLRRVAQVWNLHGMDTTGRELRRELACAWNAGEGRLKFAPTLFDLVGNTPVSQSDIEARAAFLGNLVERGVREPAEVRAATRSYRAGGHA